MTPTNTQEWYAQLIKPSFAPPAWLFGPVWTILYILIALSFGFVLLKIIRRQWPMNVGIPFAINLLANVLFTPIQFGLRSNILALIDILIVLVTILWMIKVVWGRSRWVAILQIPYLFWVSFATVLQMSITWLNR